MGTAPSVGPLIESSRGAPQRVVKRSRHRSWTWRAGPHYAGRCATTGVRWRDTSRVGACLQRPAAHSASHERTLPDVWVDENGQREGARPRHAPFGWVQWAGRVDAGGARSTRRASHDPHAPTATRRGTSRGPSHLQRRLPLGSCAGEALLAVRVGGGASRAFGRDERLPQRGLQVLALVCAVGHRPVGRFFFLAFAPAQARRKAEVRDAGGGGEERGHIEPTAAEQPDGGREPYGRRRREPVDLWRAVLARGRAFPDGSGAKEADA
mmetsp:Transcript_54511/g.150157  ORF Transcript_54511/g.150157 Transcript_54511/m.150157 type:complete len:267 (+) Transcript_54511:172-972(+)